MEPKLDGVRVVTFLNEGQNFLMYSRNGKRYTNFLRYFLEDLKEIYNRLVSVRSENDAHGDGDVKAKETQFVLDGEMLTSDKQFTSVSGLGHADNILCSCCC
jgi:ATP-dependent DNA ligase